MGNKKVKRVKLEQKISDLGRVTVAFSGGVDSSLLLRISSDIIGKKNTFAIIVKTELIPDHDFHDALQTLKQLECRFMIIERSILEIEAVLLNPKDRCYWCKKEIFSTIIREAKTLDFTNIIDGTNYDDKKVGHRPGIRALKELGIISPFAELGITKEEIRCWAEELNLANWNRPSASCLATRIPYGEALTSDRLIQVEKAENVLRNMNFNNCRVRVHQNIARIEVEENDLEKVLESKYRRVLIRKLKTLGFSYVDLDIEGYRSGSMDNY